MKDIATTTTISTIRITIDQDRTGLAQPLCSPLPDWQSVQRHTAAKSIARQSMLPHHHARFRYCRIVVTGTTADHPANTIRMSVIALKAGKK